MELTDMSDLYHPDILAYAREPLHWRKAHDAQHTIKAYNSICGDKFEIRIDIDEAEVITDISFFGYGCVVSKASTASLTELLLHKNLGDARKIMNQYIQVMTAGVDDNSPDGVLSALLSARAHPGRIQCAILSWTSLLENVPFKNK
jgi:nitrogen fixation NifU-like protein